MTPGPCAENFTSLWEYFLKEISSSAGSKQCTKHDLCPKCEYAKAEYAQNFDSDWADTGAVPRRAETPWVLSGTIKASTQGMARTPAAIRLFAEAMVQTIGLAERHAWDNFQTHTLPVWHCSPRLRVFPGCTSMFIWAPGAPTSGKIARSDPKVWEKLMNIEFTKLCGYCYCSALQWFYEKENILLISGSSSPCIP